MVKTHGAQVVEFIEQHAEEVGGKPPGNQVQTERATTQGTIKKVIAPAAAQGPSPASPPSLQPTSKPAARPPVPPPAPVSLAPPQNDPVANTVTGGTEVRHEHRRTRRNWQAAEKLTILDEVADARKRARGSVQEVFKAHGIGSSHVTLWERKRRELEEEAGRQSAVAPDTDQMPDSALAPDPGDSAPAPASPPPSYPLSGPAPQQAPSETPAPSSSDPETAEPADIRGTQAAGSEERREHRHIPHEFKVAFRLAYEFAGRTRGGKAALLNLFNLRSGQVHAWPSPDAADLPELPNGENGRERTSYPARFRQAVVILHDGCDSLGTNGGRGSLMEILGIHKTLPATWKRKMKSIPSAPPESAPVIPTASPDERLAEHIGRIDALARQTATPDVWAAHVTVIRLTVAQLALLLGQAISADASSTDNTPVANPLAALGEELATLEQDASNTSFATVILPHIATFRRALTEFATVTERPVAADTEENKQGTAIQVPVQAPVEFDKMVATADQPDPDPPSHGTPTASPAPVVPLRNVEGAMSADEVMEVIIDALREIRPDIPKTKDDRRKEASHFTPREISSMSFNGEKRETDTTIPGNRETHSGVPGSTNKQLVH